MSLLSRRRPSPTSPLSIDTADRMDQRRHASLKVATLAPLLALLAWAVAVAWGPSPVAAQTVGEPTELFRGRSGPYELIVAIRPDVPVVGTIHFLVSVLDADTRGAVDDARVLIVAIDEDGAPVYQSLAVDTPASPGVYEANITFSEPGRWDLRVDVENRRIGEASFNVPLEVRPPPGSEGSGGVIVFAGVIAVLVAGTVYVAYTARQSRRRAEAG